MFLVPKHLLHLRLSSLLLIAHICSVVIAATTASFSHKDHVPCTASLDPQHLIARKFSNDSAYEVIRCSARVGNELFQFANPVFDVSFTSANGPLSGVYMIRGKNICSPKKELCWSDFRIPGQALRELLLLKTRDNVKENNAITNDDSGSLPNGMTNAVIDFTCNVADASRNATARCLDSGSIRYAYVIKFGDRCLNSVNSESECGHRMICASGRCVCDKGNISIELSSKETICEPKVSLTERCNFTRQCQNENSLCEFDPWINAKICKCLSGFEEVKSAQNKLYCAPVKPAACLSTGSSSTTATVEQDEAAVVGREDGGGKDDSEDVVVFSESSATQAGEHDAKMSATTDLKAMLLKLGKSNQIGLIVFAGVILMALLLVAIIIRVRNRGEMQVEKHNNDKHNSNDKSKRSNSRDGPLLGALHRLSDDEEEIDVRIDEQAEEETKTDQQLIDINQQSDHELHPADTSNAASNQSLNQTANFNYSAKQSVV